MLNHLFFLFWFCFFFIFFSKVRVGAKEGGSHYWEMAVAITCGYEGYLLPLLAAHSSFYTPVFRRDVLWYGAVRPSVRASVHPSVRSSVRPTVSTKKHRCKWRIFFKFCTLVCLGVPSINLLFVLSYLIKYAHNSIISDFSIFGFHRVIF